MSADKLSAAQRSKIRRLSQPKELAPDEEGGELNIVPFLDIVVNILIFVLATVAVTFTATFTTTPPSSKGGTRSAAEQKDQLNLTVLIVNDGFSMKASGGNVAAGCESIGAGLAVPKKGEQYDYSGLRRCAQKLKNANPAFADETQVFLSGNNNIPYQVVVSAADAVRVNDDGTALFEDINFKVSK
jgi:biopolymer transport protein TolR